jgi:hypothetical protein
MGGVVGGGEVAGGVAWAAADRLVKLARVAITAA